MNIQFGAQFIVDRSVAKQKDDFYASAIKGAARKQKPAIDAVGDDKTRLIYRAASSTLDTLKGKTDFYAETIIIEQEKDGNYVGLGYVSRDSKSATRGWGPFKHTTSITPTEPIDDFISKAIAKADEVYKHEKQLQEIEQPI